MIPQIVTNETVTVISPNGANFPQTDKPQPTEQKQDSLKKHLRAEVKVIAFIISGILSVITKTKSTKSLVDGSLTMNILSVLFAFIGIIILSVSLAGLHPASEQCEQNKPPKPTQQFYYHRSFEVSNDCSTPKAVLTGALLLMLICSVLELGMAVLTTMLWWEQDHSDFSRNVIFLSRNSNNGSNMESKSLCNPAYEKQLVS
ncbi:membrane-spanning 4-domains subfamily A member 6B-like isoform X2 [Peromyscus californicus insignis]|uniref:membrane-spanning 4-domains subfamily A member 6B-like isoform X2 n=1 Tax=Peromyscus californicus insignis TaxID=564181 RepID=UPI0022A69FA1|nr:membrane-spanning 4-domains subfamily A member 6B-like isoform X2 [Peromyscus californicus insignis]